jgi:predicted branched-subunit amino acid permease
MDLFLGLLRMLGVSFLLPAFLISLAIGLARRWQTKRAFLDIFSRALLVTLGVGLPICAVLAGWLAWWIILHISAPD